MSGTVTGTIDYELDTRTYRIQYAIHPGEPMVMYDRDGGGYPGSSPEFEVVNARLIDGNVHPVECRWVGSEFMDDINDDEKLFADIKRMCEADAARAEA